MFSPLDVLGWAGIAVGAVSALRYLAILGHDYPRRLRPGARVRPVMTERHEAWQWFHCSLFVAADGMFVLDRGWDSETARWLVTIAATTVLVWDRGLWVRSRLWQRRSAD
jgi:hypothetical protein